MEAPVQTGILTNASPTMSKVDTHSEFWKVVGIVALFAFIASNAYNIYFTHLQIKKYYSEKKNGNGNNSNE